MRPRITFAIPPLVEKLWTFSYDEIYLGAAQIAAILLRTQNDVSVIDCAVDCLRLGALKERLAARKPDVVAVPVIYGTVVNGYKIARAAKEIGVSRVIFGGLPATFAAHRMMQECHEIDICVKGEGEASMAEIVSGAAPKDVAGIVYRANGGLEETPDRSPVTVLDSLPLAARHLFPLHRYQVHSMYQGKILKSTTMETKRGCPYACTFCTQAPKEGTHYRLRSPEHVIDEMKAIRANFPAIHRIMIVDNDFLSPVRHGKEILEAIIRERLGEHFEYMIATRVANVLRHGEPLLALLARANVRLVYFGIESISDPCREELGKIREDYDIRGLFKTMRKRGIHNVGSYIFGFENEGLEEMEQTLRASFRDLPSIVKYNILTPYPGTQLYQTYRERGILRDDVPLTLYDNAHQVFHHPVDLEKLFYKAYRRYHLQPGFLKEVEWLSLKHPSKRNRLMHLAHHGYRRELRHHTRALRRGLEAHFRDNEEFQT